jgi:hypothetical protein
MSEENTANNIQQQKNIAQGYMPPTENNPNPQNNVTNPITEEDIQKKLQAQEASKLYKQKREEQMAVKYRTEMQGFKYSPPPGFENEPLLAPTDADKKDNKGGNIQAEPVDTSKGEEVIPVPEVDPNNPQPVQQQQTNTKAAANAVDQSKQLKG